jgi:hypothetical protein
MASIEFDSNRLKNRLVSQFESARGASRMAASLVVISATVGCGASAGVGSDPDGSAPTRDGSGDKDRSSASDTAAGMDGAVSADVSVGVGTAPVDLGAAAGYVVLAKTGVSTVSPSVVTGDIGVSPAAATYITGFSLIADSTNVFSTSSQVTGKVYAADYASPTPANLTTAIGDMATAFTAAAGRAPTVTGLGAGSIGGMTLQPGVYRWGTGLLMATDVTLTGSATDVWIFQIAKNLTVSNGVHLVLAGGALPQNVFWQVSGDVSLGTTVQFDGTILCKTGITLRTGTSITGGLLAQTAVVLDANTVIASP